MSDLGLLRYEEIPHHAWLELPGYGHIEAVKSGADHPISGNIPALLYRGNTPDRRYRGNLPDWHCRGNTAEPPLVSVRFAEQGVKVAAGRLLRVGRRVGF